MQTKEIIEPVFKSCYELWECDNKILRRDANNLMKMIPGELVTELSDNVTDKPVESILSGKNPTLISKLFSW